MRTPSTTPRTPRAGTKEAIEHALMFLPRDMVRARFNLSASELEDIVGAEQDEPERNAISGY